MKKNKNIKLVPLSIDHIDHVMTWVNDPEVTQFFASMKKHFTREEELEYMDWLINSENNKAFSVFDRGEYIGQVSINQIHWPSGEGRLFIVVTKKHQKKGYARKVIKAILKKAFIEFDLHRLYLIVRPDNARALQLYHLNGFRQEGYLYEKYKLDGEWIDMIQMVIIRSWWETWPLYRQ